jgi:hypothetical protein
MTSEQFEKIISLLSAINANALTTNELLSKIEKSLKEKDIK